VKTIQYFSDEALERSKHLSSEQIIRFIENFRKLHSTQKMKTKSKLISIKIPEDLLETFKLKAESEGIKYQTKIKKLMMESLS
jgi:predicted DNA binding CopG/RHH family protein